MGTFEIIFTDILYVSLLIHIGLMSVAFYRVWRGENVIDRLLGLDMLSTLTLAVLVLLSLIASGSST